MKKSEKKFILVLIIIVIILSINLILRTTKEKKAKTELDKNVENTPNITNQSENTKDTPNTIIQSENEEGLKGLQKIDDIIVGKIEFEVKNNKNIVKLLVKNSGEKDTEQKEINIILYTNNREQLICQNITVPEIKSGESTEITFETVKDYSSIASDFIAEK